MRKTGVLDELVDKLGQVLPPGAADLKADFDKNARATLQTALSKMDLVTREEFDPVSYTHLTLPTIYSV